MPCLAYKFLVCYKIIRMLREIKKIVEAELGFETGDIMAERICDNGVFKGLKIEIKPSDGSGIYAIHDKHTVITESKSSALKDN